MMARPDLLRSEPLGSTPREIKGGLGSWGHPYIECSGLGGQSSTRDWGNLESSFVAFVLKTIHNGSEFLYKIACHCSYSFPKVTI